MQKLAKILTTTTAKTKGLWWHLEAALRGINLVNINDEKSSLLCRPSHARGILAWAAGGHRHSKEVRIIWNKIIIVMLSGEALGSTCVCLAKIRILARGALLWEVDKGSYRPNWQNSLDVVSHVLTFHKHNSLPLGLIWAFIFSH